MLKRLFSARPSASVEPLTFVLPVTLKEGQRLGHGAWRSSPDTGTALRLRFALASLWQHYDLDTLHEFLLICPQDEVDDIAALARTVTDDERIRVISELEVCPDILHCRDPETGAIRGWYVQQMLKMAVAERVETPFYMTLDNDVICIRDFSSADLVERGRGVWGMENIEFYERIYTPEFAKTETRTKQVRIDKSSWLLGYKRDERYEGWSPCETPAQFHTESMRAMCSHLTQRHGRPWSRVIAEEEDWTEFALYYSYLEMTGELERVHVIHGPNKVMHLEGSVWHVSDRYVQERTYDADHFEWIVAGDDGLFVVVQSWLAEDGWLPATGFGTLEEFYGHLGRVLEIELSAESG